MKIPDKVKFLIVLCSGMLFFISGCVDTSVQTIPSTIDYSSQATFVNLVTGAGAANFTINSQSVSDLGFGVESGSMTIPAGSKNVDVSFANGPDQTYSFSLETDYRFRVFMVGTNASSDVVKATMRRVDGTLATNPDSAMVTFFNGSPGSDLNGITIAGTDTTDITFDSNVAYGDFSPTMTFAPGNYMVGLSYNDSLSTSLSFTFNVAANGRYTAAAYDTLSNMKLTVLTDD